jgi:hypothetical protein
MSDPKDFLAQPVEKDELEALLSPLKGLEPPLDARLTNRRAVAAALNSEDRQPELTLNQNSRQPWWRRTVAVPVPLALGLALLMMLTLFSTIQGWRPRPAKAPVVRDEVAAANSTNDKNAAINTVANRSTRVQFSESEKYLCGIGRIRAETTYVFKD